MIKITRLLLVFSIMGMALMSCDNDDDVTNPIDENEQELITTVTLTLANQADTTSTVTATWSDPDGDGGDDPVIDTLYLSADSIYNGAIEFLNESDPAAVEDITEEIEEEDVDHELFYEATGANLTVTRLDSDANGLPLGLETTFTTTGASNGSLQVVLKHKPGTKAAGDDATDGESDIDITFPVVIQ